MRIIIAIIFITASLLLLRYLPKTKWILTVIYCAAIIYLAFLTREPMPIYHYSIHPFGAARKAIEFGGGIIPGILSGNVRITSWVGLEGIVLNIMLFIPFGYLLPQIWYKADRLWKVALTGFLVSLFIEILQLVTRLGYADVDDLINNTLGAAIGSGLFFTAKWVAEKGKTGRRAYDVVFILLIVAGIIGCFRMSEMVAFDTAPRTVALDFEKDKIPLPEVPDTFLSGAELEAYNGKYDTYVFQKGDKLVWLIGWDELDSSTEIIYHLHTNEPEKLPEERVQYKFDNRGFRVGTDKEIESIGHYRVFEDIIPTDYNVTAIVVGFNTEGTITWMESFRPT